MQKISQMMMKLIYTSEQECIVWWMRCGEYGTIVITLIARNNNTTYTCTYLYIPGLWNLPCNHTKCSKLVYNLQNDSFCISKREK